MNVGAERCQVEGMSSVSLKIFPCTLEKEWNEFMRSSRFEVQEWLRMLRDTLDQQDSEIGMQDVERGNEESVVDVTGGTTRGMYGSCKNGVPET